THPLRVVGNTSPTGWLGWIRVTAAAQAVGGDHIAWASINDMTETAKMITMRASFLLDWDPRSGSTFDLVAPYAAYSSTTNVWDAAWTKDMGAALGDKTQPAT